MVVVPGALDASVVKHSGVSNHGRRIDQKRKIKISSWVFKDLLIIFDRNLDF